MEKRGYSKDKIIEFVNEYGELKPELDHTTLEKRLNAIIQFLNEDRVQEVLEHTTKKDAGNHFLNQEMNITKARLGETVYEGYNYNIIDVLFFAVLICLFDQSLLKKIRNQSNVKKVEDEEEEWVHSFTSTLSKFEKLWDTEGDGREWGVISLNLESLFYRLTLIEDLKAYSEELEGNLKEVIRLFEPLSDQDKVEFYEKVMKNRIPKILAELKVYVQDLKENDPEQYFLYEFNRKLQNIDEKYNS